MTSASVVRGAVLVGLVSGLGVSLYASAPAPARSFQVRDRLDGPRVISWQAVSHESGGHFVLWRIGEDARQVARLDALPGTHAYRFVDREARAGAGLLVYRLTYESGDGKGSLLLVAALAEGNLGAGVALTSASLTPEALAPPWFGIRPATLGAALAPGRDAHDFFEFSGPEPPPPRH